VKNFGSDDVFVDDIVIDGKYHSVITTANSNHINTGKL